MIEATGDKSNEVLSEPSLDRGTRRRFTAAEKQRLPGEAAQDEKALRKQNRRQQGLPDQGVGTERPTWSARANASKYYDRLRDATSYKPRNLVKKM